MIFNTVFGLGGFIDFVVSKELRVDNQRGFGELCGSCYADAGNLYCATDL